MESTCHHIFGQVLKHQNIPKSWVLVPTFFVIRELCQRLAKVWSVPWLQAKVLSEWYLVGLNSKQQRNGKQDLVTNSNSTTAPCKLCNTKQLWWMSIVPWLCHVVDTRYTPKSCVSVHHCRSIMCYQRCVAAITSTNGTWPSILGSGRRFFLQISHRVRALKNAATGSWSDQIQDLWVIPSRLRNKTWPWLMTVSTVW